MYGIIYTKGVKYNQARRQIGGYMQCDKIKNFDKTVDFDTQWFIENILEKPCIYCGCNNFQKMTADRIDNSKGHYKDNIVPACKRCNCGRRDRFTVDEYIKRKKSEIS